LLFYHELEVREVSKQALKMCTFLKKLSLEDMSKFFQRHFLEKFQKSASFLSKRSLPKIFLRSFKKCGFRYITSIKAISTFLFVLFS